MLFLKFTLCSSQAFWCLGQRPVPQEPMALLQAMRTPSFQSTERANSYQPSPATTNLPWGLPGPLCQFLTSPATWRKLKQPCVLHKKLTSERGRGGTEQAEYMRAKRKINAALSNFPLSPEGERAHGTPPHPFPPSLLCIVLNQACYLSTPSQTVHTCSTQDTKMPFHLQNKISRSPNCQGQQMK